MEKKATSYRLSPEALRLLAALASNGGTTQTAVLEAMIRREAKREGVK